MPPMCSTKCHLWVTTSSTVPMRNRDSLLSLLDSNPSLKLCQAIHALSVKLHFCSNPFFKATLLSQYLQKGSYDDTRNLLDEMPQRETDTLPWNMAISTLFKSGQSDKARQLFDKMPCEPNEVTWFALISGLSQNGEPHDSLLTFHDMRTKTSCKVSSNTITSILSACIQLNNISFGKQIHALTVKVSNFIRTDTFLATTLMNMYGKCGSMESSRKIFESMQVKNVVSYSTLISNYVNNNESMIAINLFKDMIYSNVSPNVITLTTVIKACAQIANLLFGKELHACVVKKRDFMPDKYISSSLVNLYCKCGSMDYAYRILYIYGRQLGSYQISMWNSILTDHVANFRFGEALNMIKFMGQSVNNNNDVGLNEVTLAIVLPICANNFTEFLHGKELHCYAIKHGLDEKTMIGNGLLDMYCKCGKTRLARAHFDKMGEKSDVSYTTMINGYGLQGDGFSAVQVFEEMLRERNIKPDHVIFVALISACSHSGLVKEGLEYFEMMACRYKIVPREENYGSLVDLLARGGYIQEARKVIRMMHVEPGENVWGAYLGACRIYGIVDGAELACDQLLGKEIDDSGFAKLLSNVYAELGRLDNVVELQWKKKEEFGFVRRGSSWL